MEEINTTHLEQLLIHNDDIFQTSLDSEDYLESLAPIIKDSIKTENLESLIDKLNNIVIEKEEELNSISESSTNDIISSIEYIDSIESNSKNIKNEFLKIVNSLDQTGYELTILKKNSVKFKNVSHKITETSVTLNLCLQVLELTNRVHELIKDKKYFNALKNLDDLTNVHLRNVEQFSFSKKILDSIPTLRKMIKEDSFENVTKWLSILEKKLFQIGDSLFENIENILENWTRISKEKKLTQFKVNSPIELSLRDPSLNLNILKDDSLQVDLTAIFDCILVYQTINEEELLKSMYQKEWLKKRDRIIYPVTNNIKNNEKIEFNFNTLNDYIRKISGFFIMDKIINFNTQFKLRSDLNSDDLWDSLISKLQPILKKYIESLNDIQDLLDMKRLIGNFIQIMINYNYKIIDLYQLLILIFDKYCDLLFISFDIEFKDAITRDDSMPIVLDNIEEYNKLIEFCWYKPEESEISRKFPKSVPFSSIYLDYCFQIRSFINKLLSFISDYYSIELNQLSNIIIDSIEKILKDVVCHTLLSSVDSSNREQISQSFINLDFFIISSKELGGFLTNLKIGGPVKVVTLKSVEHFSSAKGAAEDKLFNMVEARIEDLLELAEYDWLTNDRITDPTFFAKDIGQYLESMFMSTFAKLTIDVKTSLLQRAFGAVGASFLTILLGCSRYSVTAIENFEIDIRYIETVATGLNGNKPIKELPIKAGDPDKRFTHLSEIIALLSLGDLEEYKDLNIRKRKFSSIRAEEALGLVGKIINPEDVTSIAPPQTSRFGFSFRRDFSS